RHDPVGGAPLGMRAAADRLEAEVLLEARRAGLEVGHRVENVIDPQAQGSWSTTASTASRKAARIPARSSASSPCAVTPPGVVTARRVRSVSMSLAISRSAEPAIASATIAE